MDQKTAVETIKKFLTKDGIGELPEWVQDAAEVFCGFTAPEPDPRFEEWFGKKFKESSFSVGILRTALHDLCKEAYERGQAETSNPAKKTSEVSYHIRVYSPDSLEWRETFYTEDFDVALAEWETESEGESYDRRVELVEERIVEVSEP